MTELSTIAIVGAGAIGCYYGGRLAQHGCAVHFLFRSGYDNAKSNGLVVKSPDGDFTIAPDKLNAHRDAREMPRVDLVIVTLKTTANDQYENLIAPLLGESTMILTLQNGLANEDRLAELFGADRVLGGLAFVCVNRLKDGTICHMDHGQIKMGEFSSPPRERTRKIAELFVASKVPCTVLESLAYGRWEKLVWNVPFNGLGAALDKTTDQLLASPHGLSLVRGLMGEIMATANALGHKLPESLPERRISDTRTMGAYRTSMQVDRQEKRPLECEAILGKPLAAARAAGVSTPYLAMLYDMVSLLT
jgi:2-dehydropantoate 2-reductase